MVAGVRRVAFTNRQWAAYQFILAFHQQRDRAPTADELARGLGINEIDSSKLMGALTTKGVLMRRIYHELAVVPASFEGHEFAEV